MLVQISNTFLVITLFMILGATFILSFLFFMDDIKVIAHRKDFHPIQTKVVGIDYDDDMGWYYPVVQRTDLTDSPKIPVRFSETHDKDEVEKLINTTITLYARPDFPNALYYKKDIYLIHQKVTQIIWPILFSVVSLFLLVFTIYMAISIWR